MGSWSTRMPTKINTIHRVFRIGLPPRAVVREADEPREQLSKKTRAARPSIEVPHDR